ncbi:MAG: GatB/YqeY domain-containing protein [Candidatus Omnitrophica bacterium]|nr:GatB/YqeY domain-containing protein [Candidatus Omnitrophota bacterium]
MLEEKILKEYQEAMKARDTLKSTLLSSLRAEIVNAAIKEKKDKLDDNGIIAVIRKQVKQHQDSIEQFQKGARPELADKEKKELQILESYLPRQLSPEEIKKIIEEAVVSCAAQGPKDMGKVMKEVMAKTGAAADPKLVSELVKERLLGPA